MHSATLRGLPAVFKAQPAPDGIDEAKRRRKKSSGLYSISGVSTRCLCPCGYPHPADRFPVYTLVKESFCRPATRALYLLRKR